MNVADEKILVVADDFTGANDAGVSLAEAGVVVDVVFDSVWEGCAQALILNSDSRAQTAEQAAQSVSKILKNIPREFNPEWTIKKIDSTLRGNLGAELVAMMESIDTGIAVIAPAFPAAGRLTIDGQCYVNGLLLTETEFASDPKTPVLSADVAAVISMQSNLNCIYAKPEQLAATLAAFTGNQSCAVIVDSQTDDDLNTVIEAVVNSRVKPLLVGSAGLCDALSRKLIPSSYASTSLLAVVGSMSEIAQKQVALLSEQPRVREIAIDISDALAGQKQRYSETICQSLNDGYHCIVHTNPTTEAREKISTLCADQGLTRAQLGDRICSFLGELTQEIINETTPAALYLSGGDVAIAVARALGATGFRITRRVAKCVPYGKFLGGSWQRPVMTKAGGFGDETTLLKVLNFIEEK